MALGAAESSALRSMIHSKEAPSQDPLAQRAGKTLRAAASGKPRGGADPQRAARPNPHNPAPPFSVKQGSNAGKA